MMKKNLIWLLALILLIPTAGELFSQTPDPHTKWYVTTKYWNQEGFPGPGHGGLEVGGMLDVGPHVYARISYGQINFCDTGDVKVLGIGGLWFPPLSEKFSLIIGGTMLNNIVMGNPYSVAYMMWSFGAKMNLLTWYPDKTFIPGMLDVSLIISHATAEVDLMGDWVMAEVMFSVSLPITK